MDEQRKKAWPELFCEKCELEREFIKFEIPENDKGKWKEIHKCPKCKEEIKLDVDAVQS